MKRAKVVILALLLVLIVLFVASRWWQPAIVEKQQVAKEAAAPAQANVPTSVAPPPAPPKPPATVEEGRSATEVVTRMITAYHTRMGENPVGTNAEITRALLGGNPLHATFSPDPPSINSKGELIDPWGTPYFFHQISGDHMQIISAGPDKILGTPDDIIEN